MYVKYAALLIIFSSVLFSACNKDRIYLDSAVFSEFVLKEKNTTRYSVNRTYARDKDRIEIEAIKGIDAATSGQIIMEEKRNIKLIFSDGLFPYPGEITYKISSNSQVMPVFIQQQNGDELYDYALLHTNSRFSYGVRSVSDFSYKFLSGWLYNDRIKILYKIRIYLPEDKEFKDLENIFFSFKCAG